MGMQAIPPIGAIGMVLFEKEKDGRGVWIGGILLSYGPEPYASANSAIPAYILICILATG